MLGSGFWVFFCFFGVIVFFFLLSKCTFSWCDGLSLLSHEGFYYTFICIQGEKCLAPLLQEISGRRKSKNLESIFQRAHVGHRNHT